MYRNQNDETLVLLTLSGEQKAYEALVVRYQASVIAAASSVVKNQFMAEDSAQDAFVTAWMKLNTLAEPSKFAPWVRKIAKNCALSTVRRFRGIMPLDQLENYELTYAQGEDPEEAYINKESNYEVTQGLEKLPEKVKRIIHLYYFEGLSILEIAKRMSISEGTVKWQLNDGRKRMRKNYWLKSEGASRHPEKRRKTAIPEACDPPPGTGFLKSCRIAHWTAFTHRNTADCPWAALR